MIPTPTPLPAVSAPRSIAEYRGEFRRLGWVREGDICLGEPAPGCIEVIQGQGADTRKEWFKSERDALARFAQLVRTERDAARVRELRESA